MPVGTEWLRKKRVRRHGGGESVTDRVALLEAVLDSRPEGVALLDADGQLVFWNCAAEAITGYSRMEILSRPIPAPLAGLFGKAAADGIPAAGAPDSTRRALLTAQHKLGHELQALAQCAILRDAAGERIGVSIFFHLAQRLDALAHGENETEEAESSQADFEERLHFEFDDFSRGGPPFGILWVGVDQAEELRKTHGAAACRAMREKVRHALAQGLRPGEQMGCWGDSGFLVIAHERCADMLAAHAQTLVGLARIADFRWWGDRVSVTVSIGAAQADCADESALTQLLEGARHAMEDSNLAGGNRATLAAKGSVCSPS